MPKYAESVESLTERIEKLEQHLNDMVHVHNNWAHCVSDLQTRLVRLGEMHDLNGEINGLHEKVDRLHRQMQQHIPIERKRAQALRRRIRDIEKRERRAGEAGR